MKVLLLTDDKKIEEVVRTQLRQKDVKLYVLKSRHRIEEMLARDRPEVVINAVFNEDLQTDIKRLRLPDHYEKDSEFWSLDLYNSPIERAMHDQIILFLQGVPLADVPATTETPFAIRGGRARLKTPSKKRTLIADKAKVARRALLDAKEALQGLASFEEDASVIGNRVAIPLSKDALTAIESAVDASLGLVQSPAVSREIAPAFRPMISFFQSAEKLIKQLEKTAMAAVKAIGVLGVLAAAIGVVIVKLQELAAAILAGG